MIEITGIKLPIEADKQALKSRIAKQCGFDCGSVRELTILRRAIDARRKDQIHFELKVALSLPEKEERRLLNKHLPNVAPYAEKPCEPPKPGNVPLRARVAVVGLGPAGLFAALTLAENGYAPLVIERGKPVRERTEDITRFWTTARLDWESNVMFGEGGAGTFSDGKLTSRSKDARQLNVLKTLHRFGAPEEILYDAKPHIGTDRLRTVVSGIRAEIERLGGEVWFSSKLVSVGKADGDVTTIEVDRNGVVETVAVSAVVLAIGQGARDTYRMLYRKGVAFAKKPFAVGVRAEHPQKMIDASQYGEAAGHEKLGAASYALTGKSGERGVYTFCMCPGGQVIASSSSAGEVVVNGMSYFARDGENANAAVIVQVRTEDTADDPLAGIVFCEEMERAAFRAGGSDYCAPSERICDFLKHEKTPAAFGSVMPSYRPGVKLTSLWDCLPDFVAQGVADGITSFAHRLRGYDLADAVLTAPETRTSAPVRIVRDETLRSVSHPYLYPVGEGAGYAGGIVSAAIDGLKAAESIIARFARP